MVTQRPSSYNENPTLSLQQEEMIFGGVAFSLQIADCAGLLAYLRKIHVSFLLYVEI